MAQYLIFIIGMVVGCITAVAVIAFRHRSEFVGYLRFYESEPGEDPIMTADLNKHVTDIYKRKYVTFEVTHN